MVMRRHKRTQWSFIAGCISCILVFLIGSCLSLFVYIDQSRVANDRARYLENLDSKSDPATTTFLTDLIDMPADEFFIRVLIASAIIGIAAGIITKIALEIERNHYP